MTTETHAVRAIYAAISAGNTGLIRNLLADEIEWIDVRPWSQPAKEEVALLSALISQTLAERYSGGWSLQLRGRGLTDVIEHVLLPFVEAGASYAPSPIELKAEGEKVVWLGCVTTIDGPTGERKDSAFAHVWTVRDGLATNLRQFIYSTTATNGSVHRGSQQIPT
ncbi:MAG: hypothetical protein WAM39_04385 [Bryobacteraceae bacterium]